MISEAQRQAQARYMRKVKQYIIKVNTETERPILDKLSSVPNKAGYIKRLILDDVNGRQDV